MSPNVELSLLQSSGSDDEDFIIPSEPQITNHYQKKTPSPLRRSLSMWKRRQAMKSLLQQQRDDRESDERGDIVGGWSVEESQRMTAGLSSAAYGRPFHLTGSTEDDDFTEYESLHHTISTPKLKRRNDVVITIQASTISSREVKVRNESLIENVTLDASSGHAVVGVVRESGSIAKQYFNVGDRVATIVTSMKQNIRYVIAPMNKVVRVPNGVDSAEAASTAYTYLIAFQSLHHGTTMNAHGKVAKYSDLSLHGKNVLIMDGLSVIGQATIELARIQGALHIYSPCDEPYHGYIKSLGAIPLQTSSSEWLPFLENTIDLVMGSTVAGKGHYYDAQKAMKPYQGRIVYVGSPITVNDLRQQQTCMSLMEQIYAQISLIFISEGEASYYDLFCEMKNYSDELIRDLEHVLFLLSQGHIKPKISKYVSSEEFSYGLTSLDPGIIEGTIICEPWRRKGPPKLDDNTRYLNIT